jgi:hypothetical protein
MDFNDPRPTDWQKSGNDRVFRSVSEACRYALGSRQQIFLLEPLLHNARLLWRVFPRER